MVVWPSLLIGIEADAPLTNVDAIGWSPVALQVISLTPEPPSLSVALSVTITLLLFQPARLGSGDRVAVVVGASASSACEETITRLWEAPPAMATTSVRLFTATGIVLFTLVPFPHWPYELTPQVGRVPSG